jgi:hypothetical protein
LPVAYRIVICELHLGHTGHEIQAMRVREYAVGAQYAAECCHDARGAMNFLVVFRGEERFQRDIPRTMQRVDVSTIICNVRSAQRASRWLQKICRTDGKFAHSHFWNPLL